MVAEVRDERIKKIAPRKQEYCCSLCGVNHQARDLMRAVLLHLVDQIEENVKFVSFLHDNQFVTEEAYQAIAKRITTNHDEVIQEERKKTCNHVTAETSTSTPGTSGCADCEKDGIMDWIGLRLCTICGHVGCDDSSKGMHATKHFVNTGHPVIVTLPDRTWKWCYIDKLYG